MKAFLDRQLLATDISTLQNYNFGTILFLPFQSLSKFECLFPIVQII